MKHITPIDQERWDNRLARLRKILEINVPDIMIATEAGLILEAWHGNKWRRAFWCLRDATRWALLWRVILPLEIGACRFFGIHSWDTIEEEQCDGSFAAIERCCFCMKAR